MEQYDSRIDAYIEKSAEFAKPVLTHIRKLVHLASPEIRETIKWGFPHFDYKGTICSMAAFKEHCVLGFWKSSLLSDPNNILKQESADAMGQFGRMKSIADLPEDNVLISYIREAIALNEKGVKVSKKPASTTALIQTPVDFLEMLLSHPGAQANFEKFSNSHRKEYISWIEEAKTEATRRKRIDTAIEWITEGKGRNWKYERKG
jgi:uncharacterized protein YdeI (YjbR/CyaY-like superfamily)